MIKFKPFPIVVSGNRRDDLLYDLWLMEKNVKRKADELEQKKTGDYRSESDYPYPLGHSSDYLNALERKPAIGPETEKYEQAIHAALVKIKGLQSGQEILAASQSLPEELYILPPGERDRVIANLEGADADIAHISRTNPADKVPPIKMAVETETQAKTGLITRTETTLLHELVHAVRPAMSVALKKLKIDDVWDDQEEFFAVVVENIFRSERDRNDRLRMGHGSAILTPAAETSNGFLNDPMVRQQCEAAYQREALARKLGQLTGIAFNPFAVIAGAPKPSTNSKPPVKRPNVTQRPQGA